MSRIASTGRAAVINALVEVGGDYMEPGLPETLAAIYVGTTNPDGSDVDPAHLPLAEIYDALAKMPTELARVIGKAKAQWPELFVDVAHIDRMPPQKRLPEKMAAIARARDSRVQTGRLQSRMLSGHSNADQRPAVK